MYKQLACSIAVAALLTLGNVSFADIWDGGGIDDSFCTPENWAGDAVPTEAEMAWRSDGESGHGPRL